MNYQQILYEQREQAAWIHLNRPKDMNSLNTAMVRELHEALNQAKSEEGIRVIVLSGKGKAFCAGADLKSFLSGLQAEKKTGPDFLDLTVKAFNNLRNFPKPVIAAVNGLALAGGLE